MASSPDARQSRPCWVGIRRYPAQETEQISVLTFLCRHTVLHEGWIAELTPLHPAAAIKTQRSPTPLSKPKPPHSLAERKDSNDDVESTLPLTAWLSSSYTVACPPQTQCRISQGRQAGSWSETPPEQCVYEHKRTTETCPCTALGEAAFTKTRGQTLPGPSAPPSTSLSWAALQFFCLPCTYW